MALPVVDSPRAVTITISRPSVTPRHRVRPVHAPLRHSPIPWTKTSRSKPALPHSHLHFKTTPSMAYSEVLLLKPVEGLGGEGDQVRVRAGYARNFLLPQGFA